MIVDNITNNSCELNIGNLTILFSYKTPVVIFNANKQICYITNKYWSVTTSKHINRFIGSTCHKVERVEQQVIDSMIRDLENKIS